MKKGNNKFSATATIKRGSGNGSIGFDGAKQKREGGGLLHKGATTNWGGYHADMKETEDITTAWQGDGTSIFDPVLCELIYRWFSPLNGLILDPFAGGSVRGIVASKLNRQYVGVELRKEQVEANREQGLKICSENQPVWNIGDSMEIENICRGVEADLLFSCPPYANLEVYSDDERDISNMDYPQFKLIYNEIIKRSCRLLKPDSFACFVVGEVRDKKGNYINFVGDTIQAFIDAGLQYYNEGILVTAVGSLPIRAAKQFNSGRKLGKTHQNILIFLKGNSKKAVAKLGECEFGEIPETDEGTN